ncbi:MAG: CDP-alcohol phosphatidyltransferase family protein [Gemmataceae bacterium]|nr:CDP-alcohol phosphatidyltransferase family protein [Gemmataceae bacterium]
MFDPLARRLIDPPLDRLAAGLTRLGLGADTVTVGGFVVGMAGCAALAFRQYGLALALILANRLADGLDGAVARRTGATDAGGYLDIVLDLIFYSGVPFGFAVGRPEVALPAAFLVWSFVGTGGSFLAYAVVAAKRGATTEARGRKSFYYAAGLMEGTETVAFFALFCLFPDSFTVLAWVFGGLCWLTTAARVAAAVVTFRRPMG